MMKTKWPTVLVLRWCGSCVLLIACWALWLTLAALLALQVWVATHRELALPGFALRAFERRLADAHVTARFGRAVFDPTGRFVIENVRLFAPPHPQPVVTVRAAYARIDFGALVLGTLRLRDLRVTGVDLIVPAMLSPSGTDEAVVSDLDGAFRLARTDYDIELCTFHAAGIPVSGRGGFHLPETARLRPSATPMLDLVLRRYLAAGRQLAALRPWLDGLQGPQVQLDLAPDEDHGARVRAELIADAYHGPGPVRVGPARAQAEFPLLGPTAQPIHLRLAADRADWTPRASVRQIDVDLTGSLVPDRFGFTAQAARLTAAGGEAMAIPFTSPCLEVDLTRFPRLQGELHVRVAGSDLAVTGEVDLPARRGAFAFDGAVTQPMLAYGQQFGLTAARWVMLSTPASLHGRVALEPGWKPGRAEGDVAVRHAVARKVTLDAARAHVVYLGHHLEVSDLFLRAGDNEARGSYTMDVATRDYRFLLTGRLRPLDISEWYKGWWPRFWAQFDFTAAPVAADVDVTGRWRDTTRTIVYCFADADHPGIRGVPLDRVRTTLFVRPYFYHVNEFLAQRGPHSARGSFTLNYDHDSATYRTLDFEVTSSFALDEWAQVHGPAGATMLAPYRFSAAPDVKAEGRLEGPTSPGGAHARVNVVLASNGPLTVYAMPLDYAKVTAAYRDGRLDLSPAEVGFAGGTASGQARFEGLPKAGELAFDASLKGADLARTINAIDDFERARGPSPINHAKSRLLHRTTGGRVDVTLAAKGQYRQPLSFRGLGAVTVTGRELGEIQLFGLLSELLSKTMLSFTSLRLDKAQANFRLEGDKIAFSQVNITGPTAAIDARGEYHLDAHTLDFNAKVFPLHQSGFVLTDAIGALLTPLSNALELKLTGPLEKPSWRFLFGPTNLLRSLTRPAGGGAAAPATGTPAPLPLEPVPPAPSAQPPAAPAAQPED